MMHLGMPQFERQESDDTQRLLCPMQTVTTDRNLTLEIDRPLEVRQNCSLTEENASSMQDIPPMTVPGRGTSSFEYMNLDTDDTSPLDGLTEETKGTSTMPLDPDLDSEFVAREYYSHESIAREHYSHGGQLCNCTSHRQTFSGSAVEANTMQDSSFAVGRGQVGFPPDDLLLNAGTGNAAGLEENGAQEFKTTIGTRRKTVLGVRQQERDFMPTKDDRGPPR
eukprot:gb/GEZN01019608.1/.p1 GENE.gb/GEZN01019608.1/~~gb/GEZN01019608.1/.p1  ORF type:complete len:223 (+),score=11.13 gb/GEZN01019608.1/:28-696(+)